MPKKLIETYRLTQENSSKSALDVITYSSIRRALFNGRLMRDENASPNDSHPAPARPRALVTSSGSCSLRRDSRLLCTANMVKDSSRIFYASEVNYPAVSCEEQTPEFKDLSLRDTLYC
jgi:hypothetical protein